MEDLGCDYFKVLKVGRNATYTSPEIVAEFLDVMAANVKESVVKFIAKCESFTPMCDESTDIGVLKQLVTYVQICDNGECRTHFLSMSDLLDGKPETIVNALMDVLASCELSVENLSSFGSGSASVMVGSRSGVAAHLRELNPGILNVHCVAHRLELTTAEAEN